MEMSDIPSGSLSFLTDRKLIQFDVVHEFDLAVTKSEEDTLKDDDEDAEIDVYIDVIEVVVVVNSLRIAKEIAEYGSKNDEDFRGSDFGEGDGDSLQSEGSEKFRTGLSYS
ncbi:hypothetical protein RYX36_035044 [Vicia faba]